MSAEKFYKVLGRDGRAYFGGTGVWRKNMWRSVRGPLVPCRNGLHLCRAEHLVMWLGPTIWRAEYDGEMVELDKVVVVRRARVTERIDAWDERTARLFAADCAKRVLSLFESVHPGDKRPRAAIQAARDFAEGRIDKAALDAARSAARAAGARAEVVAAGAARAADAAQAAVWATEAEAEVAVDASQAAARAVEWPAAQYAEREWQTGRLLDYLDGRAG
jgi:hypothetical protein